MVGLRDRAWAWLGRVEVANEIERRQAASLQVFALVGAAFMLGLELWRMGAGAIVPAAMVSNTLNVAVLLAAVWAVRTGRFRLGAWTFAAGTTLVLGSVIATAGLVFSRDALKNLAIPLALAALALGRRALWTTLTVMLAFMAIAFARDRYLLGGAGPRASPASGESVLVISAMVLVLLAIVLDRFGLTVIDAFSDSEARRRELETATAERLRALNEREQLRAQLLQAQKMESVGRLAGGVAHDFNNLLTVITGCSEELLQGLPAGSILREDAEAIRQAGARAAALTRQLLAFSRRQILQPRVLDLNRVVADVGLMLRRLLGEDVEVSAVLEPELGRVLADPNQLHQVLLNLAVNARDAMPSGGRLTIETSNFEVGLPPGAGASGPRPGRYVRVSVTDTGVGMDAATQQHVFDPFFTTKPPGLGTGLGLSTVYGIVNQSGGWVSVRSEPGAGSTFDICLPRVEDRPEAPTPPAAAVAATGTETVLVVEDQADVRRITCRMLGGAGYDVIEASGAEEALAVAAARAGPIHLLVADVVMPGTSGPALAARLAAVRPELRALFVSGYAPGVAVHPGVISGELPYVQKPFTAAALRLKVREALAAPPYRP